MRRSCFRVRAFVLIVALTSAFATSTTVARADEVTASVAAGGAVSAFVRSVDGRLMYRELTSSGWSNWRTFTGALTGEPAVVSTASGVYVFVRGTDDRLYWQRFDGTTWSGWGTAGGILTSSPAAVTDGTSIGVFVRGGDGALYRQYFDGTNWSGWQPGGGLLTSGPSAAMLGTASYVFVRGGDGALYVQRFDGSIARGWRGLGGLMLDEPSAAADSSGLSVFVRGVDLGMYGRHLDSNQAPTWEPWMPYRGGLASAPFALSTGTSIQVHVQGLDAGAYVMGISNEVPTSWAALGGVITTTPAATGDSAGVSLFARGADGLLYRKSSSGAGTWGAWQQLGPTVLGSGPVALSSSPTADPPAPPPPPPPPAPPAPPPPPAVVAGSWPGPSNTGVPTGTALTPVNGDLRVTAAGTVLDALDVSGAIYVNAPNVTIRRTHARGGIWNNSTGLSISDTEIGAYGVLNSGPIGAGIGLGAYNLTCVRCDIHGFPDGVRADGGVTVQDSWIHDIGTDDHNDGIQRYLPGKAGDDVIRHNFIDMRGGNRNAGIFYADDWRGNVTVDNNLFAGAGYSLRLHESGSAYVTNNRFIRNSYVAGPDLLTYGNIVQWVGNVYDDNGQPIPQLW